MNILYENRFNGAKAVALPNAGASYVNYPPSTVGSTEHYMLYDGQSFTCTGYYASVYGSGDECWYLQTTSGVWILAVNVTRGEYWFRLTESTRKLAYSQAQAQDYVNKVIENNKKIVSLNLLCARFSYKLSQKERQTLYALQTRLQERNARLIQDGFCQDITTSTPAGYSQFESYMQRFMASGGVGIVISSTTAIVISCVVVASLATAAYFAYKALYEESLDDVRYSEQLTKTLMDKLSPEEYEQLMRETQGIVTKSKLKQIVSTSSTLVTWGLIGAAAFIIYDKFFRKGGA